MKSLLALAVIAVMAPVKARADYHTILVGVRLHLTTTTIDSGTVYSSVTHPNGLTQIFARDQAQKIRLPSRVIEGYVSRLSWDPKLSISSTTKPSDLGNEHVRFVFDSDLVKLKYPREVLVDTGSLNGLRIPINLIQKVERFSGHFEGSQGMGEPIFIEGWKAALMKETTPVYTCTPPTERSELVWISYNPQVGEKEMRPLCKQALSEPSVVGPLMKNGNVFLVTYPAD